MAEQLQLWREWQERNARKWAAAVVMDAVICYPYDRRKFWDLQHAAGLPVKSIKQAALHEELAKVSNGTI